MASQAYTSLLSDEIDIPLLDEDFDESFLPRTVNYDEVRDVFLIDRESFFA